MEDGLPSEVGIGSIAGLESKGEAMTVSAEAAAGAETKKSVWPFALLAIGIAAVWSFAYTFGNAEDIPTPDGTIEGNAKTIGFMIGGAVPSAILTWLLFHFIVFRRRGSFTKSFFVLVLMAICSVGSITPLMALALDASANASLTRQWSDETAARIHVLSQDAAVNLQPLDLAGYAAQGFRDRAHVREWLARTQSALVIMRNYRESFAREVEAAEARLATLDLPDRTKLQVIEDFRTYCGPEAPLTLMLAAQQRELEKTEQLLVFLGSPNTSWTFEGGSVVFVDNQSLERFNVLTAELQAIGTERERLQRAAETQRNSLAEGGP